MATSGEERGTSKFGAGVMDSDAGGFTADERERSAKLLKPVAREVDTTTGFDDDDDEDDDAENDVTVSDMLSKPVSANQIAVQPSRPAGRAAHVAPPSPPRNVRIPKPRTTHAAKDLHYPKPEDPARKADNVKARNRPATVSAPPSNDSESDAVRSRVSSSSSHHARSTSIHTHPVKSPKPPPPQVGLGDNYSLPQTPREAVARYDESMDYIIVIFREMTNQNPQAVDVANMIIIFREQMRQWCLKDGQEDWSDAARFMTAFANTMHRVIHTCAQSAKARRQYRSALVPPATPSLLLSSQPDNVPDHRVVAKAGNVAQSAPAPNHTRTGGGESSKDERADGGASETHFNNEISHPHPHPPQRAPAGLHFNAHTSAAAAGGGFVPPPYAQNLDDNSQENASGCIVA